MHQIWLNLFEKAFPVEHEFNTTTVALSLSDLALLLKLFYQSRNNATKVLRLYQGQKSLRKGPVTPCALRNSQMFQRKMFPCSSSRPR